MRGGRVTITGLGALALCAAVLTGCVDSLNSLKSLNPTKPGYLTNQFYAPPKEGPTRQGGIAAELLTAGVAPLVPDGMVDATIGDTLRPWLGPMERKDLAYASQNAAVADRNASVYWRTKNPAGELIGSGTAQPVSDVYRSLRGRLCRDVRQFVEKDDNSHWQQVTLCREQAGANLAVWVVGNAY